ncbi:MAG: winged helix-turn-helix domain-containing protein, partial [Pyrinomonadaceae bacterium]
MGEQERHFYEFGPFRLDAAERVLLRGPDLVPLTPKVFDILLALVERGGHIVEKDDLMKRVWPDSFVEEGNLTQNVSLLRKALGETPGGPQFIETVSRRGYRFVATIREGDVEAGQIATASATMAAAGLNAGYGSEMGGHSTESPNAIGSVHGPVNHDGRRTAIGGVTRRTPLLWAGSRSRGSFLVLGAGLFILIGVVYFAGSKAGNGGASPIDSIAVLPFLDEAADRDSEYLNDKITDSLINSLSKLPKLRVVPRSVVANYKGKEIDPRQIGRELNVRAVVTGRVRRHGDTISIQADLIDLEKVAQIWGQDYDRKLADMLIVQ